MIGIYIQLHTYALISIDEIETYVDSLRYAFFFLLSQVYILQQRILIEKKKLILLKLLRNSQLHFRPQHSLKFIVEKIEKKMLFLFVLLISLFYLRCCTFS